MIPLQTLDYDSLLVSIGVPHRSKTSKKCVKDPFKVISKQYFMISARELKAITMNSVFIIQEHVPNLHDDVNY
jgi:hypothetical protein